MDKKEFADFITIIRYGYQKHDFLQDMDSLSFWFDMLNDLPYEIAVLALKKHVATSKWLPSVAEIRQHASELTQRGINDWSDEWAAVMKAVSAYGYMNESDAMLSLSPLTREVVRQLGWKQICCCEQNEVMSLRANFRMIYTQKADRARQLSMLPPSVRESIEAGELDNETTLDSGKVWFLE